MRLGAHIIRSDPHRLEAMQPVTQAPARGMGERLRPRVHSARRVVGRLLLDEPTETRTSRLDTFVAILIAVVSISSAIVAWRGSLAAGAAGGYDARALQQLTRREQLEKHHQGVIAQDRRLLVRYQEHASAARALKAAADAIRPTDPRQADRLDVRAQGEVAITHILTPFMAWAGYRSEETDGTIVYDPEYGLQQLTAGDNELNELRPEEMLDRAARAHEKTYQLVGVGLVHVISLFFLTLAQALVRGIRRWFAVAGAFGMGLGLVLLVLVESRPV